MNQDFYCLLENNNCMELRHKSQLNSKLLTIFIIQMKAITVEQKLLHLQMKIFEAVQSDLDISENRVPIGFY